MKNQILGNYLRTHRKKSGLTQLELGLFLGYRDEGPVSLHERNRTVPPLIAALAYEVIFRVPVSVLFQGLHAEVRRTMEGNLAEFEDHLQRRSGKGRGANETAQKLTWLRQRREAS
jgi:DNA-binding XRE family transcriptional regulator